jgi:hypothetical protein
MRDLIGSSQFRYLVSPVLSAVAGILIKAASRNGRYATFMRDDFAVGIPLMLTAFLSFLIMASEQARILVELTRF